jgi:hypothetical protein
VALSTIRWRSINWHAARRRLSGPDWWLEPAQSRGLARFDAVPCISGMDSALNLECFKKSWAARLGQTTPWTVHLTPQCPWLPPATEWILVQQWDAKARDNCMVARPMSVAESSSPREASRALGPVSKDSFQPELTPKYIYGLPRPRCLFFLSPYPQCFPCLYLIRVSRRVKAIRFLCSLCCLDFLFNLPLSLSRA